MINKPPRQLRTKTLRKEQVVRENRHSEGWLDVWLPRVSHISQFGLFLVTTVTIYFTVIPLYQKAFLEEAIAQKEIQLKQLEEKVSKSYSQIRAYAVGQFVGYVGQKCSGLLSPTGLGRAPDTKSPKLVFLENNVEECIFDVFNKSKTIQDLRKEDQELILTNLKKIAKELEKKRVAALDEYTTMPYRARIDVSALKLDSPSRKDAFDIYARMPSPGTNPEAIFNRSVSAAQLGVFSEFNKAVREELDSVRSLNWGADKYD